MIQKYYPSQVQEGHSASLSEFLKLKKKREILFYDQKRTILDYFREDSVWYTSTGTLVYFYDHSAILQLAISGIVYRILYYYYQQFNTLFHPPTPYSILRISLE